MQPTRHTHPTLSPRMVPDHMYLTCSTHSNLSRVTDRFGWIPLLLRKRAPDTIPSTPTDQPIHRSVPSFSPNPTNEAVSLSQASVGDELLGLPGPYHQHAIGTFNTCSWVPTPRSLTDIGMGYHIKTSESPHHSPRPSLLSVPLVTLIGPARSPF
jgi:hypothetical protein